MAFRLNKFCFWRKPESRGDDVSLCCTCEIHQTAATSQLSAVLIQLYSSQVLNNKRLQCTETAKNHFLPALLQLASVCKTVSMMEARVKWLQHFRVDEMLWMTHHIQLHVKNHHCILSPHLPHIASGRLTPTREYGWATTSCLILLPGQVRVEHCHHASNMPLNAQLNPVKQASLNSCIYFREIIITQSN